MCAENESRSFLPLPLLEFQTMQIDVEKGKAT